MFTSSVRIGWQKLQEEVKGQKVAIISTSASWIPGVGEIEDIVSKTAEVKGFLGLEHGIRGELQAGVPYQNYIDKYTGLPVFSCYGDGDGVVHTFPGKFLQNIDSVVSCTQDTSTISWSFHKNMADAMIACAKYGKRFIVLDRPTPLSHFGLKGPIFQRTFPLPLPYIYNFTCGELAKLLREEQKLNLDLVIIPMENWQRGMDFDETGLPWINPSINLPTLNSCCCYTVTTLIEPTNVSEGRGTVNPFEYIGTPWMNGKELSEAMNAFNLPGVVFREVHFIPTFHKYKDEVCSGVHIVIMNRKDFDPIAVICKLFTEMFRREKKFKFVGENSEWSTFDCLLGPTTFREMIEKGQDLDSLIKIWQDECRVFSKKIAPVLIYPDLKSVEKDEL